MAQHRQRRKPRGFTVSTVPAFGNLRNWSRAEWRVWLRQFSMLNTGLFFFSVALVLSLQCNLGANSWTVFHDGIARQTPLTIGQATQAVSVVMILVSWLVGIRPGIGTVLNMLMVGFFMDIILWSGLISVPETLPGRVAMLLASILMLGMSSGMYIKAGFGAGPRDSFALATIELTNLSITVTRWGMEVIVVILGILMGGLFGVGTIIFSILIGPAVGIGFRVFGLRRRPAAPPAPARAAR
jgi:uncharacterized protein